jgi:hypothetical protein
VAPALLLRRPARSARVPAVRIDSAHGSGLGASCFRPGSTALRTISSLLTRRARADGRARGPEQVNGMVVGTFEMKPPIGSKYRAIQVRNHSPRRAYSLVVVLRTGQVGV